MMKRSIDRGEPTLEIFLEPTGRWAGALLDDEGGRTIVDGCASPSEVADAVRQHFPLIRVTRHAQTPERVISALDGRGNAGELDANERELFDELLGDALEKPSAKSLTFFAAMREKGGGVGFDEKGRLVRGLPGGGVEVLREASDSES